MLWHLIPVFTQLCQSKATKNLHYVPSAQTFITISTWIALLILKFREIFFQSSIVIFFMPLLMVKKATTDVGVPGRRRTGIFKSVQFMKMNIFISILLCFRMRSANSVMPTAPGMWPVQQIQAAVIHKASDSLIHISELSFWLPGKASWAPAGKRVWSENMRVKWKIAVTEGIHSGRNSNYTRNGFRRNHQWAGMMESETHSCHIIE